MITYFNHEMKSPKNHLCAVIFMIILSALLSVCLSSCLFLSVFPLILVLNSFTFHHALFASATAFCHMFVLVVLVTVQFKFRLLKIPALFLDLNLAFVEKLLFL